MEITKRDGRATHSVNLKNFERIDYKPSDRSFRFPVIQDLATETDSPIDLEAITAYEVRRLVYHPRYLQCKEGQDKIERDKKK